MLYLLAARRLFGRWLRRSADSQLPLFSSNTLALKICNLPARDAPAANDNHEPSSPIRIAQSAAQNAEIGSRARKCSPLLARTLKAHYRRSISASARANLQPIPCWQLIERQTFIYFAVSRRSSVGCHYSKQNIDNTMAAYVNTTRRYLDPLPSPAESRFLSLQRPSNNRSRAALPPVGLDLLARSQLS